MKVLILGASGMLGYSLFCNLQKYKNLEVYGTVRNVSDYISAFDGFRNKLISEVDIADLSNIRKIVNEVIPDVVINCIGIIKQHSNDENYHIDNIRVNALFPYEIAKICDENSIRLIHFSTDCVFSGEKGLYCELDTPDAYDVYGKTKNLGEVSYGKHLTLRTSIIGHELKNHVSLVDWFLSQKVSVKGFSNAVFSGFPTAYIAKILGDNILNSELHGLYHLASSPIDKFQLLNLIKSQYKKDIEIVDSSELKIDRSLDASKLNNKINVSIPNWSELVEFMHKDFEMRYQK